MPDLMEFLGLNAPWQREAACTWGDRDRLGPVVGGSPTEGEWVTRTEAARELCAHCPVIERCGVAGDRKGEFGVWGGRLRYEVTDPADELRGWYVAAALIPTAAPSRYDREAVTGRLVRGRAPVCGGVR